MRFFVFGLLVLSAFGIAAPLKVVTTTTDLAWAAREIGKDLVEVRSLLRGTENPHYVDTIPDYIRQVAEAKVVCSIGLELEIGWLPKVLTKSGNGAVQPGGKGSCITSSSVTVLEKPTVQVDRSMGDIHAFGNPHFWLSPKALKEGSLQILAAFIRNDPEHTVEYTRNQKQLAEALDKLQAEGHARLAAALPKTPGPYFLEYHREFSYFFNAYGLKSFGSIEEKPGVLPSAGRLAEISLAAKQAGIKAALSSEQAPESTLKRFAELSGIPVKRLPTSVKPGTEFASYPALQAHLISELISTLPKK